MSESGYLPYIQNVLVLGFRTPLTPLPRSTPKIAELRFLIEPYLFMFWNAGVKKYR
jgi:hypothetical protein